MRAMWIVGLVAIFATACGLEDPDLGRSGYGSTTMAITNAEGEDDVLRSGTSLNLKTTEANVLAPDTFYSVVITNSRTKTILSQAQLLTDNQGQLELSSVAHDLGEFDDIKDEDTLMINVQDPANKTALDTQIPITPHIPNFQGHGFQVDEVQPPHIFSADKNGKPINAFVVGATPASEETAAPIYVVGKGFPTRADTVHLYVVKDSDKWQGKQIPKSGEAGHIHGPLTVSISDGKMATLALTWKPGHKEIGPYDILVDVDRNGSYDYAFTAKDGSDGENKVGLTIQYSANWFAAKRDSESTVSSRDEAKKSYAAADAAATKAEAVAAGNEAKQKAAQARAEANKAKTAYNSADSAATKAKAAFTLSWADATVCAAQVSMAANAAKTASEAADKAAKLVKDTIQAQKIWEAKTLAVREKMASQHLIVNLAYNSSSRGSGQWANTYTTKQKIYTYINPPIQKGSRHAWLTKWVLKHQSFAKVWNNPDMYKNGKLALKPYAYHSGGGVKGSIQKSCTNSPPVSIINPGGVKIIDTPKLYDIVFDYNGDGYYEIGKDFIDIQANNAGSGVQSGKQMMQLADDKIYGFKVIK